LREDWIATHTTTDADDALPGTEDVVEYNAETFKGESV
jgi:hypothetical protein